MKKQFNYNLEWKNMDSVDQRSDYIFYAVWSWSTVSTTASCVVISKESLT